MCETAFFAPCESHSTSGKGELLNLFSIERERALCPCCCAEDKVSDAIQVYTRVLFVIFLGKWMNEPFFWLFFSFSRSLSDRVSVEEGRARLILVYFGVNSFLLSILSLNSPLPFNWNEGKKNDHRQRARRSSRRRHSRTSERFRWIDYFLKWTWNFFIRFRALRPSRERWLGEREFFVQCEKLCLYWSLLIYSLSLSLSLYIYI